MKINLSKVLLIIVFLLIFSLIIFIIFSKQNLPKESFNIKKGDILNFDDNIKIEVLNISSTICKKDNCDLDGEIEVSLKVNNNNEISNYTLKSKTNNKERIINSNYYILLNYDNEEITIDVKDKSKI